MKKIYNITKFISIFALATALTATSYVPRSSAIGGSGGSTSEANLCSRAVSLRSTNEATIKARITTMNRDFATRLDNIAARKTTIDQKLATTREEARVAFEAKIAELEARVGLTDAQKQAITTFKTDMKQANTTRQTAVDAARATYREALRIRVEAHQAELSDAATAYQTAVQAAFATAKTDCGNGSAMATLRASIKLARTTLNNARSDSKTREDIKQLMTTRNAAIRTANQAFAEAAKTYTATLTIALQATDSTTTETP